MSPEQSRSAALQAARALLLESGPQAVTLKAVGARIGRTHANLLHHFGSAAGLQQALAQHLTESVCRSIGETVQATRAGLATPRDVVDLIFDSFGREGGGALAGWMLFSGQEDALDPIIATIRRLVDDLFPQEEAGASPRLMHEITLALVLLALGDALIGPRLADSLRLGRVAARDRAEAMVLAALSARGGS
jgi:AcrR family transcriptional regulator